MTPEEKIKRLEAALLVYDSTVHLLTALNANRVDPLAIGQVNAAREAHEWAMGQESMIPEPQPLPRSNDDDRNYCCTYCADPISEVLGDPIGTVSSPY